jgi:predicted GIY-YIG superfamily endonuclease
LRGSNKTFAGKYFCYKLLYYEIYAGPLQAIRREKEIKLLSRKRKEELIRKVNPDFHFYRTQPEDSFTSLQFLPLAKQNKSVSI